MSSTVTAPLPHSAKYEHGRTAGLAALQALFLAVLLTSAFRHNTHTNFSFLLFLSLWIVPAVFVAAQVYFIFALRVDTNAPAQYVAFARRFWLVCVVLTISLTFAG